VKVVQNAEINIKKELEVNNQRMWFKWWERYGGEGDSWKQNSAGIAL
jgi:hypothetical protein